MFRMLIYHLVAKLFGYSPMYSMRFISPKSSRKGRTVWTTESVFEARRNWKSNKGMTQSGAVEYVLSTESKIKGIKHEQENSQPLPSSVHAGLASTSAERSEASTADEDQLPITFGTFEGGEDNGPDAGQKEGSGNPRQRVNLDEIGS